VLPNARTEPKVTVIRIGKEFQDEKDQPKQNHQLKKSFFPKMHPGIRSVVLWKNAMSS